MQTVNVMSLYHVLIQVDRMACEHCALVRVHKRVLIHVHLRVYVHINVCKHVYVNVNM